MSTPVLKDSKKINVTLRQLKERIEVWDMRYADIEKVIESELTRYLEKMNGDLPTYLDIKREVFPKLYQYSSSNLNTIYVAWIHFVKKGYHEKFQIIDGIFLAPK